MSNEQKENMLAAIDAEQTVALIEVDEYQREALMELDLLDDVNEIAANAFSSALRGKVQGTIDRAIKAKYIALQKGKPVLAEECEKEIQKFMHLKKKL